jgi:hypothetical protein
MRVSLAIAALLASLAVAGPALATPRPATGPGSASDTERRPAVHSSAVRPERWSCTPTGCSRAPGSSSWGAALGFAVTTLASRDLAPTSPRPPSRSGSMRVALLIERLNRDRGTRTPPGAWRTARAGDEVHVVARRAAPCPGVLLHPVSVPEFWQPLRVCAFSRAAAKAAPRGDYDVVYSLARTVHQDCYRAGAGSHLDYLRRRYAFPARQIRRLSPRHACWRTFRAARLRRRQPAGGLQLGDGAGRDRAALPPRSRRGGSG